jgi:lipopolysaccharide/colanic/teichoic acid biosynthesis glycosyltransferase
VPPEDLSAVVEQEQEVASFSKEGFYVFVKRTMDILISAVALIVLSPVFLIVTIIIRATSPGPAIFVQERIGKDGVPFRMYKFRSMVENAEELLKGELKEKYEKEFKLHDDPRLTKIGKWLRHTSLDELPQFLNIFVGDLSLIGPRPILENELQYYGSRADKLLSAKPGLTGYWQAYARNDSGYENDHRQQMELYYVDHKSFALDVKIFFKTFSTVVSRRGAN